MYKEIIISMVIVVVIIVGDIWSQNYTKENIEEISGDLDDLKTGIIKEEDVKEKIIQIEGKWKEMYQKLAYYIEHDELEKVETQISAIKGNIEIEENKQGVPEIDKCIFVLNHIKDKEAFMIQNIF